MKLLKITPRIILGILLGIVSSLLGLVVPLLVRQFINLKTLAWTNSSKQIFFVALLIIIVNLVVNTLSDYLISSEGDRQVKNIRLLLQEKIFTLPQNYFDKEVSGSLTSRVINDVGILRSFLTATIPTTVTGIITIVGIIITTFVLDLKLTLLMLLVFPIDAMVMIPLGHISEKIANQMQNSLGSLTGVTSESIKNIKTIKLNNAETTFLDKVSCNIQNLFKLSLKTDRIAAAVSPIQSMLSFVLIMGIILYGTLRVKSGTLSTGTLGAFMMYFFQIISPVNEVAMFYSDKKQMEGATRKIREIINEPSEELDKKASPVIFSHDNLLQIKNGSFAYQDRIILKDINLKIQSGEKVALVGATGAGKSTIVNLLTRLYPLTSGSLVLNNQDANNVDLKQWRSIFSVVLQENSVLTGSIRDNLLIGVENNVTDDDMWQALDVAELGDFVRQFPDGLDTVIGEQGRKLSGGQRQRLQIARAYLRKFKFLVLDEVTSNLDSDTESKIMQSLDNVAKQKNCGVIAIAHRLSTIVNSDRIYFLKDGQIIASGTHNNLYQKLPEYRHYVDKQELKERMAS